MKTLGPIVLVLFVASSLSGCVDLGGSTSDAGPTAAGPATFDETTGGIEGVVHDDNLMPIEGAQVGLLDIDGTVTVTDEGGEFSFSRIPPGSHRLVAQRIGFGSAMKAVLVEAGQVVAVDIELSQQAIVEPYHLTKDQRGLFGCGATWRPAVAVSGIAICGVLGFVPGQNFSQYDKFLLHWQLAGNVSEWDGVVYEMEWKSTQAFGKGLTMIWEVEGCSNFRNSTFARDAGASPLRSELNATLVEEKLENNTKNSNCDEKENCDDDVCKQHSRVFSSPDTLGTNSPADVGITLQQPFTQYMTEFYNEEPPPGFSAVPDT